MTPTDPRMEAFEKALDDYARLERLDAIRISNAEAERVAAARSAVLRLYDEAREDARRGELRDYLEEESRYLSTEAAGPINKRAREVMLGVSARLLARCAFLAADAASSTTDKGESK